MALKKYLCNITYNTTTTFGAQEFVYAHSGEDAKMIAEKQFLDKNKKTLGTTEVTTVKIHSETAV